MMKNCYYVCWLKSCTIQIQKSHIYKTKMSQHLPHVITSLEALLHIPPYFMKNISTKYKMHTSVATYTYFYTSGRQ